MDDIAMKILYFILFFVAGAVFGVIGTGVAVRAAIDTHCSNAQLGGHALTVCTN
jgi:hypothetical protein